MTPRTFGTHHGPAAASTPRSLAASTCSVDVAEWAYRHHPLRGFAHRTPVMAGRLTLAGGRALVGTQRRAVDTANAGHRPGVPTTMGEE